MCTKVLNWAVILKSRVFSILATPAEILDPAKQGAAAEGGALYPLMQLLDNYGSGFMAIGNKGFVYIAFFCALGAFVGFMVHRNNQTRIAEHKSAVVPLLIGAVGGFAVAGFITLCSTIGQSLFTQ